MQTIIIDILLFGFIYATLRAFLFIRENKRKRNDSDDDDGGIPVSLPPDIDLPPGVCLPDGKPPKTRIEPEEAFA